MLRGYFISVGPLFTEHPSSVRKHCERLRCFYRYLHKSINLAMAQTSNAIDRRFSTPYYTNTNYSYIKSKPNGAFSAGSCFGRSGVLGRGGVGERPNGVVRERLLIWQSLPKTGNYSSFVFRLSRVGRGVWSPVRRLKLTDELTRNEFEWWWWRKEVVSFGGEKSSTPDNTAWCHCGFS